MNPRSIFRLPLDRTHAHARADPGRARPEMAEHEAQQKLLRDAESIADWLCGGASTAVKTDETALLNKGHAIRVEERLCGRSNHHLIAVLLPAVLVTVGKGHQAIAARAAEPLSACQRACCDAGALDKHRGR